MRSITEVNTHQLPDAANAVAPSYLLRLRECQTVLEYFTASRAGNVMSRWPRGDGHRVLVIPGFLAGPESTRFLRKVLRKLGYHAHDWGLGVNLGYRPSMTTELPARLTELVERGGGRRISIIGWSAGGIYARELARALPDDVRCVITLGSPFRGNHQASHAWRLWKMLNGGAGIHAVSAAARTRREQPLRVPTTCIYSKTDGIVAWQCCTSLPAPHTENIQVRSTHLGYGHNLAVLRVIADRLAQPEGSWRPYAQNSRNTSSSPTGFKAVPHGVHSG